MRLRHFSHNLRDNLFDVIFFSKVLHFVAVFISPTRCGLICLPMAGELTRIFCELLFATILHQRRYGEYAVYNYKLFPSFLQLLRQLGDDETAEGGIVLLFGLRSGVRVDAEELRIGTRETLVGDFDVLVILLLPKDMSNSACTMLSFFFRFSPEDSTFRLRVVFVSFSCRFRV